MIDTSGPAASRSHQLPGLAGPQCRGAQHEVGAQTLRGDPGADARRRLPAARRQRPVEVGETRIVPTRFRMPQQTQKAHGRNLNRSEEHTSELQSLMRISYAVLCLKNKNNKRPYNTHES